MWCAGSVTVRSDSISDVMLYNIAGLNIDIPDIQYNKELYSDYLLSGHADIDGTLQPSGSGPRPGDLFSDPAAAERLAHRACFAAVLFARDGFLLHASCVVKDGEAYCFTAPSGTGKSTHTRLWQQVFGKDVYILNDDAPALRNIGGKWYASGTPWAGSSGLNRNCTVPLKGIAFLQRDQYNHIQQLSPRQAVSGLLRSIWHVRSEEQFRRAMAAADHLLGSVPVWELYCNMEDDAAMVSCAAMSKGVVAQ